jgi:TolB-like protein
VFKINNYSEELFSSDTMSYLKELSFNDMEMLQIKEAFKDGLSIDEINKFAKKEFTVLDMYKERLIITYKITDEDLKSKIEKIIYIYQD